MRRIAPSTPASIQTTGGGGSRSGDLATAKPAGLDERERASQLFPGNRLGRVGASTVLAQKPGQQRDLSGYVGRMMRWQFLLSILAVMHSDFSNPVNQTSSMGDEQSSQNLSAWGATSW